MKARNREINIFNMSLLDILCGALGAFCFLMLSLLPYYRPPGEDINITRDQKKLLDEVQQIKDLAERLKFTSNAEDLTELVKKLQEQILALENEIKRLQGHLNALLAENAELKKKIEALEKDRQRLLARVGQLEAENKKLAAENTDLRARLQRSEAERQRLAQENDRLRDRNEQLQRAVNQKVPWVLSMTSENSSQAIDLSLHEVNLRTTDGGRQPEFDPGKRFQPVFVRGDKAFNVGSNFLFVSSERAVGSLRKFYVSLASDPPARAATRLAGSATGSGLGRIEIPTLGLTPDRPWILAGFFSVDDELKVTFREATDREREAEWNRLMHPETPEPEKPPAPAISREDSIERMRRMNQSAVDGFLKSRLFGLDPDAQGRIRAFAATLIQAKNTGERRETIDRAMRQAKSAAEQNRIQTLITITIPPSAMVPPPPPPPPPGPTPKPGPAPTPAPGPAGPSGTEKK